MPLIAGAAWSALPVLLVSSAVPGGRRSRTQVFFGIRDKALVAALGAEVISRTLIFRSCRCALGLDLHTAYWIGLHDYLLRKNYRMLHESALPVPLGSK